VAEDGAKGTTYFLWKKDDKYVFAKDKKDGYAAAFKVPDDREVRYSKKGLPVLRPLGSAGDAAADEE